MRNGKQPSDAPPNLPGGSRNSDHAHSMRSPNGRFVRSVIIEIHAPWPLQNKIENAIVAERGSGYS
ncbi:hypothetical protein [Dactylosporangium sp. NPDC048998]|uniref:hypothetical protein n=1 Tax=Dactylosporangium sp. NPDC048998 TaxID=3363976 RepID=UPI00371E97F8